MAAKFWTSEPISPGERRSSAITPPGGSSKKGQRRRIGFSNLRGTSEPVGPGPGNLHVGGGIRTHGRWMKGTHERRLDLCTSVQMWRIYAYSFSSQTPPRPPETRSSGVPIALLSHRDWCERGWERKPTLAKQGDRRAASGRRLRQLTLEELRSTERVVSVTWSLRSIRTRFGRRLRLRSVCFASLNNWAAKWQRSLFLHPLGLPSHLSCRHKYARNGW